MTKTLLATALLAVSVSANAAQYEIDSSHTYPNFTISHLGFSLQHGRFNTTTGSLVMDREAGTGSVEIVIDAASIDTGHGERDEHLRNEDFFNVSEYPQITFNSTEVTFTGETSATVVGDLSMLGVTQPMTLTVTDINCGEHPMNGKQVCGFMATGNLKRSDFGMGYGVPAIGDDVNISLQVEAVLAEDAAS